MTTLARIRVEWTGAAVVGGGVSTFYSSNANPATLATAIRTFFSNVVFLFPTSTSILVIGNGDTIVAETGALNGTWTMTQPAVVVGTGTGNWAAGVGARVRWNTNGLTRGRRVKGSTFLVPLTTNNYATDGTIDATTAASTQSAVTVLAAADSGSMRIWSRPSAPGAGDGAAHAVTTGTFVDAVTWLRTRRT
jgi:hypothetical protein